MPLQAPGLTVMVAGALGAAIADIRTRKIPNVLCGALAAAAVAVSVPHGWAAVAATVAIILAVFTAGTFAFERGWLGGGDVKLLAACSGFAGYPGSITLILYVAIAGAIVSLFEAARLRRLRGLKVPYGVAIAGGACAFALSTSPTFHFLRLPL
jgi:prepilin peptidase CpaA